MNSISKKSNIKYILLGLFISSTSMPVVMACYGFTKPSSPNSCNIDGAGCGYTLTSPELKECDSDENKRTGNSCRNDEVTFTYTKYILGDCVNGSCEGATQSDSGEEDGYTGVTFPCSS